MGRTRAPTFHSLRCADDDPNDEIMEIMGLWDEDKEIMLGKWERPQFPLSTVFVFSVGL